MQQILVEIERLKQLIGVAGIDAIKFVNDGNKSAGTRVRKSMQDIKATAHEIRRLISEVKNEGTYKLGGK